MSLEAGKTYECWAEHAEFGETESGWLYLELTYRFKDTGDTMKKKHFIASPNGSLSASNIPVDKDNPKGPKIPELQVLEKRYGVDLSNFEFDLNKLSKEIVVRASIAQRTWVSKRTGESHTSLEIKNVWPRFRDGNGRPPTPPDKSALMRKFGAVLRAGHAAASRPAAPAVAKPNAPAPAPAAPPAPPSQPAPDEVPSSLDECWAAFVKATPEMDQNRRTNEWFALLQRSIGHQKQESATPQEWGMVMANIAAIGAPDDVPF